MTLGGSPGRDGSTSVSMWSPVLSIVVLIVGVVAGCVLGPQAAIVIVSMNGSSIELGWSGEECGHVLNKVLAPLTCSSCRRDSSTRGSLHRPLGRHDRTGRGPCVPAQRSASPPDRMIVGVSRMCSSTCDRASPLESPFSTNLVRFSCSDWISCRRASFLSSVWNLAVSRVPARVHRIQIPVLTPGPGRFDGSHSVAFLLVPA